MPLVNVQGVGGERPASAIQGSLQCHPKTPHLYWLYHYALSSCRQRLTVTFSLHYPCFQLCRH
ncbi:hypothetical protein, partial [Salmonella enterica]|uniref:hypothetical protein n=1 Tax=Salmonella enterica TaxID=28901 RepID=UPI001F32B536